MIVNAVKLLDACQISIRTIHFEDFNNFCHIPKIEAILNSSHSFNEHCNSHLPSTYVNFRFEIAFEYDQKKPILVYELHGFIVGSL